MPATQKVIKFYKIRFDENWFLVGAANQIFEYVNRKPGTVQVCYEAPQGSVFTATLICKEETKALIHRDVIHIRAQANTTKAISSSLINSQTSVCAPDNFFTEKNASKRL